MEAANHYISLFALISLPVVILDSFLLDHVNHRIFSIGAASGYIIAVSAAFLLPDAAWILPFVIMYPLFEGAVSTCLWTIIPQTARDSKYVPYAAALFTLFSNAGMLIGPPVVCMAIGAGGYKAAVLPVAVSMIDTWHSLHLPHKRICMNVLSVSRGHVPEPRTLMKHMQFFVEP